MISDIFRSLLLAAMMTPLITTAGHEDKNVVSARWVDSVYNALTPAQRIAQLMVIRAWSWKDSTYQDSLASVIQRFNPGGICFFKGSPLRQAMLTNRLQKAANTPLLVMTDAEWGVGMRLDSAFAFPRNMTLGASGKDSLLLEVSRQIARDCKRMGIHINLAPVVDVNNNPLNPVIGFRSFGEDPAWVARKGAVFVKGHREEGVIPTAKHFPGHGDTDTDSHYSLPLIHHSRERIDSVELFPFKALIDNDIPGIMIAHLYIPELDSTPGVASTLSGRIIDSLLKGVLHFRGFVISDALDMQGVTKYFKPGEIEVRALMAGNDILLLPQDMEIAVKAILAAADSGFIADTLIEQKVKGMLALKASAGLMQPLPIDTADLYSDLNPVSSLVLERQVYEEAVTLVRNDLELLPIGHLERRKVALVTIGDTTGTPFETRLRQYTALHSFNLPAGLTRAIADSIIRDLTPYDVVIIGLMTIKSNPESGFGLSGEMIRFTDSIAALHRTILTVFGTPYALNMFRTDRLPESIMVSYQNNPASQEKSAELIFGGLGFHGTLPVSTSGFPSGTGICTDPVRLSFTLPEECGFSSADFREIDSLIQMGLERKAYPGCQVLFARHGKVFYHRSFGYPAYGDSAAVTNEHLYDLASLTKIFATTLAIMKLDDEGLISPEDSLGKFLPYLLGTNKSSLKVSEVMAHQAGLQPWIRFYEIPGITPDSILKLIISSPLLPEKKYQYSDLGFYLLKEIAEEISGRSFGSFLEDHFYRPLGLTTITFSPTGRTDTWRIVPTAIDSSFRGGLVRGIVHDQGAFLLGGISGHAGLFSNSADLAVILQMLLNGGSYGGREYLTSGVIQHYTGALFSGSGNRRGLGFDKPPLMPVENGPVCRSAPASSYGHSGFTGTYAWADPDSGLLYVFLSNRTYPDDTNNLLGKMNIRTEIHQKMYDILQKYHMN